MFEGQLGDWYKWGFILTMVACLHANHYASFHAFMQKGPLNFTMTKETQVILSQKDIMQEMGGDIFMENLKLLSLNFLFLNPHKSEVTLGQSDNSLM